jgi:uncharacterized YkwD family protein
MKSKKLFSLLVVALLFISQVGYAESYFGNVNCDTVYTYTGSYGYSLNDLINSGSNTYNVPNNNYNNNCNNNSNYNNGYNNVVISSGNNWRWNSVVIPGRPTTPNVPQVPDKPTTPTIPEVPTTPTVPEVPTTPTTPNIPVAGLSAEEQEVVRLVNIEREKAGLSPFVASAELSRVARIKSEDMGKNNYFNHTSPTYGSPFDMMKQFGIKYSTAGENIARGYLSAQSVVSGWMNSSGHRANILNPSFNKIGVGAYTTSNNTTYWTQMFTN